MVAVTGDDFVASMICSAPPGSYCRVNLDFYDLAEAKDTQKKYERFLAGTLKGVKPASRCSYIYFDNHMSDFAINRATPKNKKTILSLPSRKVGKDYILDADGTKSVEICTENEYLEIRVDGKWKRDISFDGEKMAVWPIHWMAGHEKTDHLPVWDFSGPAQIYTPADKEWSHLLDLAYRRVAG